MSTLFVSATGGHLAQLDGLASRMPPDGEALWVTHSNEQSRSMLADRDVEFVPYVGVRNIWAVLRCLRDAHRLWRRRRITRAISTGSGIALGYLPYLAARGVSCHYVESATRVHGPSLTGRLLQWVPGVRTYTQHPSWADRRWYYGGSDFDRYQVLPRRRQLGTVVRVVVTVGIATEYPFRRLIEPLAALLAEDGPLQRATGRPVEVLWQTGDTPVDDLGLDARAVVPAAELVAAMGCADIIVSHAGMGSALAALGAGRQPVLAARLRHHGEQIDDHQQELGTELERRGLAISRDASALTVDDLLATLDVTIHRASNPPPFDLRP